jgi:tetratricopeptide (TPR) repeat protein
MENSSPSRSKANREALLGLVVLVGLLAIVAGSLLFWLLPKGDGAKVSSSNPDAELNAAYNTFYVKGDHKAGLEQFRLLSERYPTNAKVWREYGQAAYFLDPYSAAIPLLQKAAQLDANDPLPHLILTLLYATQHKSVEAQESAQTATRLNSDGWMGHAALAAYYSEIQDVAKADAELDAMEKKAGAALDEPFYNFLLAGNSYNRPDCKKVVSSVDKVMTVWSGLAYPLLLKSACLIYDTENYKAEQSKGYGLLLQAQRLQPTSSGVLNSLAYYHAFQANDPISAQTYLDQALKSEPMSDTLTYLIMGQVLRNKGEHEQAFKYYESCLQKNPRAHDCTMQWAWALLGHKIKLTEKDSRANTYDVLESAAKKGQSLASYYDKLPAKYAQTKASYYYLMGSIEFHKEEYIEAVDFYQKAADLQPKVPSYYVWMAWAYVAMEDYDSAEITYKKALAIDSKDKEVIQLGEYLEKLDD